MNEFDPSRYSATVSALLTPSRLAELGAGTPNREVFEQLTDLASDDITSTGSVQDPLMVEACISALWLFHDYLDHSHTISQSIETPTGSYWHGIMHRREPDASNAKYWFRRVGDHPIFAPLCRRASQLAEEVDARGAAAFLTSQGDWDPFDFIDLVELARTGSDSQHVMLCRRIQLAEWQLLFDFCHNQAVGQR